MRINWKVRFQNPYFWISIVGIILTAMNVSPETLTSWAAVKEAITNLISNPYMIGSVAMALIGAINDPTTKGILDSKQAMEYVTPKK